jgi:hypothetical protein
MFIDLLTLVHESFSSLHFNTNKEQILQSVHFDIGVLFPLQLPVLNIKTALPVSRSI